jgi:hypothetical protein
MVAWGRKARDCEWLFHGTEVHHAGTVSIIKLYNLGKTRSDALIFTPFTRKSVLDILARLFGCFIVNLEFFDNITYICMFS